MKEVFGDTKSLSPSERGKLEKLGDKRSNPATVIDAELARRGAKISQELGLQVGLILGRDGRVSHVGIGSKDRIYLPDLGRLRLDGARLRRLRLVVFLPPGAAKLSRYSKTPIVFSRSRQTSQKILSGEAQVQAPEIQSDLLTDLEKLRLDAVVVIASDNEGEINGLSMAYLEADTQKLGRFDKEQGTLSKRKILYQHASDAHDLDIDFPAFIKALESGFSETTSRAKEIGKDRAVLVGVYSGSAADAKDSMDELLELARTADIQVVDTFVQRRRKLDPRTVIGKGKIEELVLHCLDLGADLIVFDRELSPGQLRSVTQLTELRVLDRSMLILDIFAQRAKSSEGRLQVELAQLKYSLPRLTERDSGLSRLTGGIGGRGPGETKLEIGRRRARDRIVDLESRIEKLSQQRGLRRERRQLRGVPVVGIVGYTNVGKSTLLNALTKGTVLAENKLFATLDPSSRRMRFPNEKEVVFVDTVGFIRELPKELVLAFRATLEEVGEADLLVHVVDASNQDMKQKIDVVDETLKALGFGDKPKLLVLNKIDLLSPLERQSILNTLGGLPISALTREGFEELIKVLQEELMKTFEGQDPGRFLEISQW